MKKIPVIASILIFIISCNGGSNIKSLVHNLGLSETGIRTDVEKLHRDPYNAAKLLMAELVVVKERRVNFFDLKKEDPHALHVIACIMALQSLTGKVFCCEVKNNKNFVMQGFRKKQKCYPFYIIWMSRDAIFTAPAETQELVIAQWKKFFDENPKFKVAEYTFENPYAWYQGAPDEWE